MTEPRECEFCFADVPGDAVFCPQCGEELDDDSEPSAEEKAEQDAEDIQSLWDLARKPDADADTRAYFASRVRFIKYAARQDTQMAASAAANEAIVQEPRSDRCGWDHLERADAMLAVDRGLQGMDLGVNPYADSGEDVE